MFLYDESIQQMLGNQVQYVEMKLNDRDFIETLGLKTQMKFEDFLQEFKKWRMKNIFKTTWEHVFHFYLHLQRELPTAAQDLKIDLLSHPFVFLPTVPQIKSGSVSGKFFTIDKVCWEDPSGLINSESSGMPQTLIMREYHGQKNPIPHENCKTLRNFFLKEIRINRYPSAEEYLAIVTQICQNNTLPNADKCRKIYQLFAILGSRCIKEEYKKKLKNWYYGRELEENLYFYGELNSYMDNERSKDLLKTVEKHINTNGGIFPTARNVIVGNITVSLLY